MNEVSIADQVTENEALKQRVESLENDVAALRAELEKLTAVGNQATILAFSGDMDRLMSAFIIATGAVAMGMEVTMFFTFWGVNALRKDRTFKGKPITEKLMAAMMPKNPAQMGTSKMNMMGLGSAFLKRVMKGHKVSTLPELIDLARELDVNLVACQMSMELMGIARDELLDDISYGGVATYLGHANDARLNLFI